MICMCKAHINLLAFMKISGPRQCIVGMSIINTVRDWMFA